MPLLILSTISRTSYKIDSVYHLTYRLESTSKSNLRSLRTFDFVLSKIVSWVINCMPERINCIGSILSFCRIGLKRQQNFLWAYIGSSGLKTKLAKTPSDLTVSKHFLSMKQKRENVQFLAQMAPLNALPPNHWCSSLKKVTIWNVYFSLQYIYILFLQIL